MDDKETYLKAIHEKMIELKSYDYEKSYDYGEWCEHLLRALIKQKDLYQVCKDIEKDTYDADTSELGTCSENKRGNEP